MKAKTAFESGNSPPKVSESGALIQTSRGLEEVKRRITEAFEKIRQHPAQHPVHHSELTSQPQVESYTEQHSARFHERVKRLSLVALESSSIMKARRRPVFEIVVPTESAEELIKEALGNERTKTRPE